jgi:hypothetical protein
MLFPMPSSISSRGPLRLALVAAPTAAATIGAKLLFILETRVALGLGTIQWACLLVLLYYANDMPRWLLRRRGALKVA